jgi:hypothetical protein
VRKNDQVAQRQHRTRYQAVFIRQCVWDPVKLFCAAVQRFTKYVFVPEKPIVILHHFFQL